MRVLLHTLIVGFILLIHTGCTATVNQYRVTIDAINAPDAIIKPCTYSIEALHKEETTDDLHFQRQSQHLVKMLTKLGYTQSVHANLAEQIIYFNYGIEKIQEERRVYREPDFHFGVSIGYPYGYYRPYYHPFWYDAGYTSYRTYEKRYALHDRHVTIVAKEQTGKELWRVDVSSVGESTDLNTIVPMLIEAAEPYIGTNTKEPIQLVLSEKRKNQE